MITITYLADKSTVPCSDQDVGSIACEGNSNSNSMLIYVDYTKGSEASLDIAIELKDDNIGQWYPLQQYDGTDVENVVFSLATAGKYRIPIPSGANEGRMRVIASLAGAGSAATIADLIISPEVKIF